MQLKQLQDYVFKTRIELNEDGSEFIELREPTQKELVGMGEDEDKYMETLTKLFPVCVVDSSIENENGEKATGKEIFDNLKDSGSMMSEIINTWLTSIPFRHRLLKNQKSEQ